MSRSTAIQPEEIPARVKDALVDEYGESQDRCVRGYVPSQSLKQLMEYLDADQIQQLRASRTIKDSSESFKVTTHDLPAYIDAEEQLKREVSVRFDRADHKQFDWGRVRDFITDADLQDIAVNKLVFRMENEELRDHLFSLLQAAIDYPPSYKNEFTEPFYFVMESRAPEKSKDYDNIRASHDDGYLEELGWKLRTLDLMAIWSHHAWVKSQNQPMGVTQHEIEELSFNQRENDRPVFGAVNSMLVVNRWRTPFGKGLTDMRHFEWEEEQMGWVRTG